MVFIASSHGYCYEILDADLPNPRKRRLSSEESYSPRPLAYSAFTSTPRSHLSHLYPDSASERHAPSQSPDQNYNSSFFSHTKITQPGHSPAHSQHPAGMPRKSPLPPQPESVLAHNIKEGPQLPSADPLSGQFRESPLHSWDQLFPPFDPHPVIIEDPPYPLPFNDNHSSHHEYRKGESLPYLHIQNLGVGSFAVVDEVKDVRIPGNTFARKLIRVPRSSLVAFHERVWNEIAIVKRLTSVKHFVQIIATYSERKQFGIIMTPVADMNLEHYMERFPKPDVEDPIYGWFGCLATGLDYLHRQKIKHRDIKPANILVKNKSVLYADFGIAKDVSDEASTSTSGYVDAKSPMYCAPEVALELKRGRSSDVFSLGCVFIEMVTTLMWFRGVDLEKFSTFRTTDGQKAYHKNMQKNLRWLLSLFGLCASRQQPAPTECGLVITHSNALYAPFCLPLEWCYAMVQPSPCARITAQHLITLIESVNRWQDEQRSSRPMFHEQLNFSKNPDFTGRCCRPQPPVAKVCGGPTLLSNWPEWLPPVVLDPKFGATWEWANQQLGYNSTPPILRNNGLETDLSPI